MSPKEKEEQQAPKENFQQSKDYEKAQKAHALWSEWMGYMLSGDAPGTTYHPVSGAFLVDKATVDRWKRLASTPFDKLTEDEKKSDYEVAKKYL